MDVGEAREIVETTEIEAARVALAAAQATFDAVQTEYHAAQSDGPYSTRLSNAGAAMTTARMARENAIGVLWKLEHPPAPKAPKKPKAVAPAARARTDFRNDALGVKDIKGEKQRRQRLGWGIRVPFEKKDIAKALGGLWDNDKKVWLMPDAEARREVEAKIGRASATSTVERPHVIRYSREKGSAPAIGSVFRGAQSGKVFAVIDVSSDFISDDGESFGAPFDRGWQHTVYTRAATAEETATLVATERAKASRSDAVRQVADLEQIIKTKGSRPPGRNSVSGDVLLVRDANLRMTGGGSWFQITNSGDIWFIQNNGSDGADWAQNNVATSGAGAIGWRLQHAKDVETRLRALDTILGGNVK